METPHDPRLLVGDPVTGPGMGLLHGFAISLANFFEVTPTSGNQRKKRPERVLKRVLKRNLSEHDVTSKSD